MLTTTTTTTTPPIATPTLTLTTATSTHSIRCTLLDDVRQAGGHTESVDKLLEAGASLDNTDKRSLNALGHAIQKYDRILCLQSFFGRAQRG